MFPDVYDVGVLILNVGLAGLALAAMPVHRGAILIAVLSIANAANEWGPWLLVGAQPGAVSAGLFTHVVAPVTVACLLLLPFCAPRRRLGARGDALLLASAGVIVLFQFVTNPLFGLTELSVEAARYVVFHETTVRIAVLVGMGLLTYDALTLPSASLRRQALLFASGYVLTFTGILAHSPPFVDWMMPAGSHPFEVLSRAVTPLLHATNLVGVLLVPGIVVYTRVRGLRPTPTWSPDLALIASGMLIVAFTALDVPRKVAWDVVRPTLFVYGVAALRFVEVDVHKRLPLLLVALVGALASVFGAATHALAVNGSDVVTTIGGGILAAALAVALLAVPVLRALMDRSGLWNQPEQVYQAAVEESILAGRRTEETRILEGLRKRLGLSPRDHERIVKQVREALGFSQRETALHLGRYEEVRSLGRGGSGEAFLARDTVLEREVVLKIVPTPQTQTASRALREARAMAKIHHAHVIAIHDVASQDASVVLVLEYAAGGTVHDHMQRGRVDAALAQRWVKEALEGLAAIHDAGLIHRDLKPTNLLLAGNGKLKVADLGIATAQSGGTMGSFATVAPGAGTLAYMSPEQARGQGLDPRSDLYSLGVVLYELLAGKPYLTLDGVPDLDARLLIHETEPELPLPSVEPHVNKLLASLLAKDPADRPATAQAAARLLDAAR